MSAAKPIELISVEDYLAGERRARRKHEYSAGRVYAMAGGRNAHNSVAVSFLVLVGNALRGKPCQPFNSDTKVRVRTTAHTRFYYPDAMVVCDPNPGGDTYQDRPVVIAEVTSVSTRRIDEGEKREAYLAIPTLSTYLMIESNAPRVVACVRTAGGGLVEQVYVGLDAVVPLPSIGVSLSLGELYERIDFAAAAVEDAADEEERENG